MELIGIIGSTTNFFIFRFASQHYSTFIPLHLYYFYTYIVHLYYIYTTFIPRVHYVYKNIQFGIFALWKTTK